MRSRPRCRCSGLSWLAALFLLPGVSLAQPPAPRTAASPAGPLVGARAVLPNGLVVLVAERPGLPIVSARVAVAAGAVLDPPDKAGLANLTALLLTRGTRSRTGPEIDRAIEFVGGSLEGEGGRDRASLALAVLKKDRALGFDLLADVLVQPTFPDAEFERTREEVRASVRRSEEDPGEVAGRLLRQLAFPGHPYGWPVTGTEASLARITRDDVAGFYATAYRPDTTVIAVAGDVTLAEVRAEVAARLGAWTTPGSRRAGPGAAPQGAPLRTESVQRDLTQATVLIGQATVPRTHPDHYALVLAAQILGGGSSSRLYTRVREERGLVYSIGADYVPAALGGLFLVTFQSKNPQVREVLALCGEEFRRLRRERVSDDELTRAKAYLVGSFPLRMDTSAEVAALLLRIEQFDLGLDYPARYRRAVEAVTADDVVRAARSHWDPDLMSLVVVANLREAGLSGSGPATP